jgi:hypothetical protein
MTERRTPSRSAVLMPVPLPVPAGLAAALTSAATLVPAPTRQTHGPSASPGR